MKELTVGQKVIVTDSMNLPLTESVITKINNSCYQLQTGKSYDSLTLLEVVPNHYIPTLQHVMHRTRITTLSEFREPQYFAFRKDSEPC